MQVQEPQYTCIKVTPQRTVTDKGLLTNNVTEAPKNPLICFLVIFARSKHHSGSWTAQCVTFTMHLSNTCPFKLQAQTCPSVHGTR